MEHSKCTCRWLEKARTTYEMVYQRFLVKVV